MRNSVYSVFMFAISKLDPCIAEQVIISHSKLIPHRDSLLTGSNERFQDIHGSFLKEVIRLRHLVTLVKLFNKLSSIHIFLLVKHYPIKNSNNTHYNNNSSGCCPKQKHHTAKKLFDIIHIRLQSSDESECR